MMLIRCRSRAAPKGGCDPCEGWGIAHNNLILQHNRASGAGWTRVVRPDGQGRWQPVTSTREPALLCSLLTPPADHASGDVVRRRAEPGPSQKDNGSLRGRRRWVLCRSITRFCDLQKPFVPMPRPARASGPALAQTNTPSQPSNRIPGERTAGKDARPGWTGLASNRVRRAGLFRPAWDGGMVCHPLKVPIPLARADRTSHCPEGSPGPATGACAARIWLVCIAGTECPATARTEPPALTSSAASARPPAA